MDGSGGRQNIFPTGDGETGNPSSVNGRNPTAMVNNEEWDLDKLDYKLYEKHAHARTTELRGSKPVGLREGDSPSFVRPASRIGTRHRAFAPTHAQPQDTGAPRLRPWE